MRVFCLSYRGFRGTQGNMKEMMNKQFTLDEDGKIFWQAKANNPAKGEYVANLVKGEAALKPAIELAETEILKDQDKELVLKHITDWLEEYINTTLEPLVALLSEEGLTGVTKDIAKAVYEGMGVIPRAEIEQFISQLDADLRRELRHKKINLGPVLVFQPPLNKPAAIRLRALLWCLSHGKTLPATVPADGIVSQKIEEGADIDKGYYQSIGYPVYGPKAIRIDMLDRVIVDIYESSKDWEFKAKHQYAEWLGSNIADMYQILEALGHKKTHDPEQEALEKASEEKGGDVSEADIEVPVAEDGKPQLATFKLRKGKISNTAQHNAKSKPPQKKEFKKKPPKKQAKKPAPKQPMVVSAQAKNHESDNPFAVLEQLKKAK